MWHRGRGINLLRGAGVQQDTASPRSSPHSCLQSEEEQLRRPTEPRQRLVKLSSVSWASSTQEGLLRTECTPFNPGRPLATPTGATLVSSYFLGCSGQPGRKHSDQDSGLERHGDTSCTEMASPDLSSHHEDPGEWRKGKVIYKGSVPLIQPH